MMITRTFPFPRQIRFATALAGALAVFAVPATAQAPGLEMLGQLDAGMWELRFRDGEAPRRLCVRNGQELVQLRHAGSSCRRFVVEDSREQVTVQYTCRGNGYGRTSIRRESNTLVQVNGQGIEGDLPFEFQAEARRIGSCR